MGQVTMADQQSHVTVGVDSHKDVHVAAVIDQVGQILATTSMATTDRGSGQLVRWAQRHGQVDRFGVEGTGSFAAGLTRYLRARGYQVLEVNRPNRQTRRRRGKSDTVDAESAARAALAGQASTPKAAIKARTQAANQLDSLVITAPEELRVQLRGLATARRVEVAAAFRPGSLTTPVAATKLALRELARRHLALTAELERLDTELAKLVRKAAPKLVARRGVGTEVAGMLLVAAGDNPDRLRSEAAFAHLCGAAPIEASSGKTVRHRLNRGGDRQANNGLWVTAMCRMHSDQRTKDYVARRTKEGKSKKEIIRCLKRYIARELYRDLVTAVLDKP
jgi:transposase